MCDELTVHTLVANDVAVTTTSAVGVGLAESDIAEHGSLVTSIETVAVETDTSPP